MIYRLNFIFSWKIPYNSKERWGFGMGASQVLVLNASYEPMHIISWKRALQLLFSGKVEVLEESVREVRTVRITIKVPMVLRLLNYVPLHQKKGIVRFSRANVFARDQHQCQYCGDQCKKSQLTLDHVIPVVQGGPKTWENIVTSCRLCNQKKGGRTPKQAGMRLIRKPKQPEWLPKAHLPFSVTALPKRWQIYLQLGKVKWEVEIQGEEKDFETLISEKKQDQ